MLRSLALLSTSLFLLSSEVFGQVNLSNGLSAYYSFNGNFQDMSGNGNHGTAVGGTTFGVDHIGNLNAAAYFDGFDDWVSIASNASITASDKMTLSFRFSTANIVDQQVLISKTNHANVGSYVYNQQFQIGIYCSQSIGNDNIFFATDHDANCQTSSGFLYAFNNQLNAQPPAINTWYCVVMTFDSGQKKIFVDGNLTAQQTIAPTHIDSCNGGLLKFGVWWQNDLLHYNGLLDEVRFYKRVLNSQEIDSLCNLNSPGTAELASNYEYKDGITVIPNPSSDRVKISLPAWWSSYSLDIYNAVGQKVYAAKPLGNTSDIDCGRFPSGIYFIKCIYEGRPITSKFIKQ
jgi:hypothetical protein